MITRREFLKDIAFVAAGLVVGGGLPSFEFPDSKIPRITTAGNPLAIDMPRIGSEWIRGYSDDEINQMVHDPSAVLGACAILIDEGIVGKATPVRIEPQIPNGDKIKAVFLVNREEVKIETTSDKLIVPQFPLDDWLITESSDVPDDSEVMMTRMSVNRAVNFINTFYLAAGISDVKIVPISKSDVIWITTPGKWSSIDSTCNGGACIENSPLGYFVTSIKGKNGYDYVGPNGQHYYYQRFQAENNRVRQLSQTIHERVHTGQQHNFLVKYYDQDEILTAVLESFTELISLNALKAVYLGANQVRDKLINDFYDSGTRSRDFFGRLIADFNSRSINGSLFTTRLGANGDMVTLQTKYDDLFGKGVFKKLVISKSLV